MHTIDVIDHEGHQWELLAPPIRRKGDELWLLVANNSQPLELRSYMQIPVPVFTEWFVPATYCYCDIGAGGNPCISREHCDERYHDWCSNAY